MRIPRFMKVFVSAFIVIAFFRALNTAPPFAIQDILYRFQDFRGDYSDFTELLRLFTSGDITSYVPSWDSSLGIFENIFNVLQGFFQSVSVTLRLFFGGIWDFTKYLATFTLKVWSVILYILGFPV